MKEEERMRGLSFVLFFSFLSFFFFFFFLREREILFVLGYVLFRFAAGLQFVEFLISLE
jgi:hypothetical protein